MRAISLHASVVLGPWLLKRLYGTPWNCCGILLRMVSTLEDQIVELCAKAVAAKGSDGLSSILSELRAALQQEDKLVKVQLAELTRMRSPNVF